VGPPVWPDPPRDLSWLDLSPAPGEPAVRIDLTPAAHRRAGRPAVSLSQVTCGPAELLLNNIAMRLLATGAVFRQDIRILLSELRLAPREPRPAAPCETTLTGMEGQPEQPRWRGMHGALGFALIPLLVLKLSGVIGWSWWLVLLPVWLPTAIALPFAAVILMSAGTDRLSEPLARWQIRRRHANDNPGLWLWRSHIGGSIHILARHKQAASHARPRIW